MITISVCENIVIIISNSNICPFRYFASLKFYNESNSLFIGFIFNIRDIAVVEPALMGHYLIGAAVSFLSGLLAVYVLLDVVRRGKFMYFGFYCLLVGTAGLIYFIRS